jgi:hypothetical protein
MDTATGQRLIIIVQLAVITILLGVIAGRML